MRVAVLIVVLAGCDQLFKLEHLPDASPDATATACSDPRLMFCGGFEEATPTFFVAGAPQQLPLQASMITAMIRPPDATGTNGLWFDSQGGALFEYFSDPLGSASVLDATFAINFAMLSINPPTTDVGLFDLDIGNCYVELELNEQVHALRIHGVCGSTPPVATWLTAVPLNYFRAHFTLDVTHMTATIAVEGQSAVHLDFTGTPAAGAPGVHFGVDGTSHAGFVVGFDDIAVTAM